MGIVFFFYFSRSYTPSIPHFFLTVFLSYRVMSLYSLSSSLNLSLLPRLLPHHIPTPIYYFAYYLTYSHILLLLSILFHPLTSSPIPIYYSPNLSLLSTLTRLPIFPYTLSPSHSPFSLPSHFPFSFLFPPLLRRTLPHL